MKVVRYLAQKYPDLLTEFQRICKEARVPVVTAHGMRGLHATLAMEAGTTGHAASIGHESVSTTETSYARREAVTGAKQRKAMEVLAGGRGVSAVYERSSERKEQPSDAS